MLSTLASMRGGNAKHPPTRFSIPLTLVGANRARSWFPVLGHYFLDPGFVPLPVSRVHACTVFPIFVFPAPRRFSWLCGDNASRSGDPCKRKQHHQPSFVKHDLLLLFVWSIDGRRKRRECYDLMIDGGLHVRLKQFDRIALNPLMTDFREAMPKTDGAVRLCPAYSLQEAYWQRAPATLWNGAASKVEPAIETLGKQIVSFVDARGKGLWRKRRTESRGRGVLGS